MHLRLAENDLRGKYIRLGLIIAGLSGVACAEGNAENDLRGKYIRLGLIIAGLSSIACVEGNKKEHIKKEEADPEARPNKNFIERFKTILLF